MHRDWVVIFDNLRDEERNNGPTNMLGIEGCFKEDGDVHLCSFLDVQSPSEERFWVVANI